MGEIPKFVFMTGSPSIDEIKSEKITSKKDLISKYNIPITNKTLILLFHPTTTESEKSESHISEILKSIIKLQEPTISIAPNSDYGYSKIFKKIHLASKNYPFISYFPNVPRSDFLSMLKNCGVLIGNSSSGIIEASYFQIPVVNIGIRQNGRERGHNVIDIKKINSKIIEKAIIQGYNTRNKNSLKKTSVYGHGNASKKIVSYLSNIKLDKELIQKQITY